MDLALLCWLSTGAYAIHIMEEFILDWRNWARNVLKLPADWNVFYVTNSIVIVLGFVAAEIAPRLPVVALGFPALMLINATFFHVAPFLWKRGRFSPGLFTALLLFYPLGYACYRAQAGVVGLSSGEVAESLIIGGLLMMTPILFLKIKSGAYFNQDRP
jgi:hypothetical protein